jgi:hypothetical protein
MPIFPALVSNSGGNKPEPPTGITLTTASTTSLNASWTAPVYTGKHPLLSYIISLYNSSGVLINASYATVSHPSTSTTITGLSSSTTYSIRITLRNSINIDSDLSLASSNATTSAPPPPPPPPPPTYSTWYCSYSGTDGRNRSIQSSDLTDTSGCDYAVVCSPFGYPEYPGYVGCVSFPPPPPPPPPSGGCPSTCDCCGFAGCGYCYIQFGNECFCDD